MKILESLGLTLEHNRCVSEAFSCFHILIDEMNTYDHYNNGFSSSDLTGIYATAT